MFLVYVVLCLFLVVVSTSAIDCLEKLLQNDLLCVEWDVKPYTYSLILQTPLAMPQIKIPGAIIPFGNYRNHKQSRNITANFKTNSMGVRSAPLSLLLQHGGRKINVDWIV